jgi:hypothetical protein
VYPLDWPVTETLATLGFVDSFRQVYPDPIADPGLTWPAARPKAMNGGWNPGRDAPADRIDYVQSIGPATAIGSSVVGEDVVDPWPSDHRGLVSTFSVTPEAPPDLVSPDQALGEVGDEMTVRYRVGEGSGRITATAAGGGSPAATLDVSTADGSVALDTSGWAPGRYDLALAGSAGTTIATSTIWVAAPGHGPTLDVPRVVGEGDAIRASWTDAPGNRWDWIGIYHRGADPHVAYYLLWAYTEATIEGSVALDRSAVGTFPLPPGRYTALLLVDDSYRPVASADFTIR